MTNATLGVATIGQAPREDIRALLAAEAPAGTRVILRGCLDGLSEAEVAARAPIDDDATAIVLACTGEFPPFPGDAGVVFPSRVLNALAGALLPAGRLGILIPLP